MIGALLPLRVDPTAASPPYSLPWLRRRSAPPERLKGPPGPTSAAGRAGSIDVERRDREAVPGPVLQTCHGLARGRGVERDRRLSHRVDPRGDRVTHDRTAIRRRSRPRHRGRRTLPATAVTALPARLGGPRGHHRLARSRSPGRSPIRVDARHREGISWSRWSNPTPCNSYGFPPTFTAARVCPAGIRA